MAQTREEEEPILAERLVALQKCLGKLSDSDHKLIQARYIDRVPIEQIARRFTLSRRTLFRSLERVKDSPANGTSSSIARLMSGP